MFYNIKKKELIYPDTNLSGVDHQQEDDQQKIEQILEKEYEEHEYKNDNKNAEDIYNDEIDQ